jgi:hypothetical protein
MANRCRARCRRDGQSQAHAAVDPFGQLAANLRRRGRIPVDENRHAAGDLEFAAPALQLQGLRHQGNPLRLLRLGPETVKEHENKRRNHGQAIFHDDFYIFPRVLRAPGCCAIRHRVENSYRLLQLFFD